MIARFAGRIRGLLARKELNTNAIADSRAQRNAGVISWFLIGAAFVTWRLGPALGPIGVSIALHFPAVVLYGSVILLAFRGAPQFRRIELLLFNALAYGCSFLPLVSLLLQPRSQVFLASVYSGIFVILFLYPLRQAIFCYVCGALPALLLAGIPVITGGELSGLLEPLVVVLMNLPIWIVLRAYQDQATKDKVFAVKMATDTIAHEMRTPMQSIEASCLALRQTFGAFVVKHLSPQQQLNVYTQTSINAMERGIKRIEDESTRMLSGLNLLLQNASSPKSIPADTQVLPSVAECIRTTISNYPFYEAAPHELITTDLREDFPVYASPVFLNHVLTNLIKNSQHAIQKKGSGGITVSLSRRTTGSNLIRFRDTGAGIPKATLAHIFNAFYTTRRNGQGLGLTFSANALALFGAGITVESVDGEYTEFVISFPQVENTNASHLSSHDDDLGR